VPQLLGQHCGDVEGFFGDELAHRPDDRLDDRLALSWGGRGKGGGHELFEVPGTRGARYSPWSTAL